MATSPLLSVNTTSISNLVSNGGRELIEIIVHNAYNIPLTSNRSYMKVYVTCHSNYTQSLNSDRRYNSTASHEDENPTWNERIIVETLEQSASDEELCITIFDDLSKRLVAIFYIPWTYLRPFYQYHFELIYKHIHMSLTSDIKLYVSLTRKTPELPKNETTSFYGLEVLLTKLNDANIYQNEMEFYAIARIVPNYDNYKKSYLLTNSSNLKFVPLTFPLSNRNGFTLKRFEPDGYPRVTAASKNHVWNESFCFVHREEIMSMFNEQLDDVALVIEYYPLKNVTSTPVHIRELFGWCKIKLDDRSKKALANERGSYLRTENMLIEKGNTRTSDSRREHTCEVVLKLIDEPSPITSTLNTSQVNSLPVMSSHFNDIQPVYLDFNPKIKQQQQNPIKSERNDYLPIQRANNPNRKLDLPSKQTQGSDFKEIYLRPTPRNRQSVEFNDWVEPPTNSKNIKTSDYSLDDFSFIPTTYREPFLKYQKPNRNDSPDVWSNYYKNLNGAYKNLIRQLIDEVDLYKHQLRSFELSNVQLNTKVKNFEEKKLNLLKLAEVNEMDRAKLNQTFLELNMRLRIKTQENILLKEQVDKLQLEIDSKKDSDTKVANLTIMNESLKRDLLDMKQRVADAAELEDTVNKQELVIERFENLVKKLMKERKKNNKAENEELDNIHNEINNIRKSNVDLKKSK